MKLGGEKRFPTSRLAFCLPTRSQETIFYLRVALPASQVTSKHRAQYRASVVKPILVSHEVGQEGLYFC